MTDPKQWEVPSWYVDPPVRRKADPLVDQQDPPPRQEPARTWRELSQALDRESTVVSRGPDARVVVRSRLVSDLVEIGLACVFAVLFAVHELRCQREDRADRLRGLPERTNRS